MRHVTGINISARIETAHIDIVRRRSYRRILGQLRDVVVDLLLIEPSNFEIAQNLARDARMGGNILLDLAKHQALAGIVGTNEDCHALGWHAKRLGKFGKL